MLGAREGLCRGASGPPRAVHAPVGKETKLNDPSKLSKPGVSVLIQPPSSISLGLT